MTKPILYSKDITQVYVNIIPGPTALAMFPLLFPNGVCSLQGEEKEKIKWKRNSPLWNKKTDASGAMHRGRNPDESGEITISLLDTNPQNEILQILAYIPNAGGAIPITDVFSILVDDRFTGKPAMNSYGCFIEELPEGAIDVEPGQRAWKVAAAKLFPWERGGKAQ